MAKRFVLRIIIGNGTWELNGNKMSAKNTYGDTFSATIVVNGNEMEWFIKSRRKF